MNSDDPHETADILNLFGSDAYNEVKFPNYEPVYHPDLANDPHPRPPGDELDQPGSNECIDLAVRNETYQTVTHDPGLSHSPNLTNLTFGVSSTVFSDDMISRNYQQSGMYPQPLDAFDTHSSPYESAGAQGLAIGAEDFECQESLFPPFQFMSGVQGDVLDQHPGCPAEHFLPPLRETLNHSQPGPDSSVFSTSLGLNRHGPIEVILPPSECWNNPDADASNVQWSVNHMMNLDHTSFPGLDLPSTTSGLRPETAVHCGSAPNESQSSGKSQRRPVLMVKGAMRTPNPSGDRQESPQKPVKDHGKRAHKARQKTKSQQQEEERERINLEALTEDMLRDWKVQDLNRQLKGMPKELRNKFKKDRRTLKNRIYAHNSRHKKNSELKECKEELNRIKASNHQLQCENDFVVNKSNRYQAAMHKIFEAWRSLRQAVNNPDRNHTEFDNVISEIQEEIHNYSTFAREAIYHHLPPDHPSNQDDESTSQSSLMPDGNFDDDVEDPTTALAQIVTEACREASVRNGRFLKNF
ncbi:unnamed protein product [Notodromas monacha]|uniref:Basic leucine zipper domain-containing protein n=1 Tax=Notodromas monacha TaxID=399045 RepID=A0A7R9BEK0_9CRUS|nr:unnamed protein product [Notodromas monacha]CAG0912722.1 unnamed protein product [Notodromas monacha]